MPDAAELVGAVSAPMRDQGLPDAMPVIGLGDFEDRDCDVDLTGAVAVNVEDVSRFEDLFACDETDGCIERN